MTKEYKMITMHVGDYETQDFKRGFKHMQESGANIASFSWPQKTRTSDAEFQNRLVDKVIPVMTQRDFTSERVPNGLIVTFVD